MHKKRGKEEKTLQNEVLIRFKPARSLAPNCNYSTRKYQKTEDKDNVA